MQDISAKALRIVTEQPDYWEAKLFVQVVSDEIEGYSHQREEYRQGISSGAKIEIPDSDFFKWFAPHANRQADMLGGYERVINHLGENVLSKIAHSGVEPDVDAIIRFGQELGQIYRDSIDWSQQFRRLDLPQFYDRFLAELAKTLENLIESIEYVPGAISDFLEKAEAAETGEPLVLDLTIDFAPRNSEALRRETQILRHRLGLA